MLARMLDLAAAPVLSAWRFGKWRGKSSGGPVGEHARPRLRARGLTISTGEAVQFLEEEDGEPFDLITAADVMPYLGDLAPLPPPPRRFSMRAALISTETLADHQFGDRD